MLKHQYSPGWLSFRALLCLLRLFLPGNLHDRATAVFGTAATFIELLQVVVILARAFVLVIVCELGSRMDRRQCINENPLLLDHCFTVWIAGVVDKSRVVPVYCPVDDCLVVDREEKKCDGASSCRRHSAGLLPHW